MSMYACYTLMKMIIEFNMYELIVRTIAYKILYVKTRKRFNTPGYNFGYNNLNFNVMNISNYRMFFLLFFVLRTFKIKFYDIKWHKYVYLLNLNIIVLLVKTIKPFKTPGRFIYNLRYQYFPLSKTK